MTKHDGDRFGAEPEQIRDKKWRTGIDGFKGVDADVPKVRVVEDKDGRQRLQTQMVRMAPPRGDRMQVTTTGGKNCSDELARKKARYKLMRSAFQFAPLDDKAIWERRRDIAFAEMQIQAHIEQLAAYEKDPTRKGDATVRPEQVKVYKRLIREYKGEWLELTGQGEG